ncbi:MAG: LysR family transcriptional regulator [Alphaproteobacteria bacterium]
MDRLHEMGVFVAVASAGGFAKAGKRLRLSPPAVTRAVARLEARLGTRLLNRTTRSLGLTDAGTRFLASAQRLLADIDSAEKDAAGDAAEPRGHLALTASATFGRSILFPIVRSFLAAQPHVTVSVLLLDRVVDLIEEGVDVAVRIAELPDSSLVARRVGAVRRLLVASPGYLAARGTPEAPVDLRAHAIIAMSGLMPNREWRYVDGGKARSIQLAPRLEVNDALAALDSAEAGEGITLALSYMVAEAIRAGRLVAVLNGHGPVPVPVHLVHAQGRRVAPAVRAFMDFAAPCLAAALDDRAMPVP